MNINIKDIITIEDLNNIKELKNTDIVIRSKSIDTLRNLNEINGSLGIVNSSIKSLGDLNTIRGNFFISGDSNLKTLENSQKKRPTVFQKMLTIHLSLFLKSNI